MATRGPFARAGGQLNQCLMRIAEREVTSPEEAVAFVSTQPDGQILEIALSTTQKLSVRLERLPADGMEQICSGTTEQQVLITLISSAPKPRRVVYRAPVTLGDILKSEGLSSAKVLLRTCEDQVGKLIEHPGPDLRLYFGSTILVTTTSGQKPVSPKNPEPEDAL